MTNAHDRPAGDLESELHRRYSQAFEQYANLTKAFMSQWQGAAAGTPPSDPAQRTQTTAVRRGGQACSPRSAADQSQTRARFAGVGMANPGAPSGPAAGASPLEQLLKQQEQIARRLFELAAQCQRLQSQLSAHWAAVGQSAAQNFIGSMQAGAAPPSDPSQWTQKLYSAWIDNAEKAYAQAARGAEYVQLLGALTNAANAFKSEQNALMELWAKFFDHPTRTELDALNQQLRELREQVSELRRKQGI